MRMDYSRLLSPKFNLSLIAADFSGSTARDALSPTGHPPPSSFTRRTKKAVHATSPFPDVFTS
ncbi:hypothetical protein CCUS01_00244 [Colletotrichum cuscutae]|uniref:Uncharacterized protein n=1 Tax=Colletotrichum cuscutae TaxID=1209917 RepID=A0AAI9YE92_9PEZI|nr:hypothetical protein CCUS01_00244 [Colletotrichum cuscutae]